jgi:hypothetical protein
MLERWLEGFDGMLHTNVPNQLEDVDKIGNLEDLELEQEPTVTGIEAAIRKLKNNKAPGMDPIKV